MALALLACCCGALVSMSRVSSAAVIHRIVADALLADDSLDVPGILWLEHLNLLTGPKEMANKFYVDFIGMVPEPGRSWHVNLGSQQFHLAAAAPGDELVLTGNVGLTVPSLGTLRGRIERARKDFGGTQFDVADAHDHLLVTCPWGNHFVVREASTDALAGVSTNAGVTNSELPKMARAHLGLDEGSSVRELGGAGIRYVSFQARRGTVERIGRFYAEMLGATVHVEEHAEGEMAMTAAVLVGPSVHFVFFEHREEDLSAEEEAKQAGKGAASDGGEGLHACVYIHSFKRAFERLDARGLIWTNPRFRHLDTCDSWEEAHASRQFRFKSIVDLDTMEPLLELEHEVRAQRHFQFYKRTHYPPGSGL